MRDLSSGADDALVAGDDGRAGAADHRRAVFRDLDALGAAQVTGRGARRRPGRSRRDRPVRVRDAGGQLAVAFRTNSAGQINEQGDLSSALTTQTDPTTQFIGKPDVIVES